MKITEPIQFNGVYYLESQNPNMNPIAIRPTLSPYYYFAWEDTGNGRILQYSKIFINGQKIQAKPNALPEQIEMIDKNNQVYKLAKLTIDIFNEKLKHLVAAEESLNFQSDQELQNYYLKTDFYTVG